MVSKYPYEHFYMFTAEGDLTVNEYLFGFSHSEWVDASHGSVNKCSDEFLYKVCDGGAPGVKEQTSASPSSFSGSATMATASPSSSGGSTVTPSTSSQSASSSTPRASSWAHSAAESASYGAD